LQEFLMRKKFNHPRLWAVILLLALAGGCWIPEEFDARMAINRDGSCVFSYDGTLAFSLALMAMAGGSFSSQDEALLKKEEANFRREPGIRKIEYLRKGRYKVSFQRTVARGEAFYFPSPEATFFSVLPQSDGTLAFRTIQASQRDLQELREIGAKVAGTLSVTAAEGIQVVQHNADSAAGPRGPWRWTIRSADTKILLVAKPAP
jgi:hypothetical protein